MFNYPKFNQIIPVFKIIIHYNLHEKNTRDFGGITSQDGHTFTMEHLSACLTLSEFVIGI